VGVGVGGGGGGGGVGGGGGGGGGQHERVYAGSNVWRGVVDGRAQLNTPTPMHDRQPVRSQPRPRRATRRCRTDRDAASAATPPALCRQTGWEGVYRTATCRTGWQPDRRRGWVCTEKLNYPCVAREARGAHAGCCRRATLGATGAHRAHSMRRGGCTTPPIATRHHTDDHLLHLA